ncbi:protein disulfide-isomerase A3-like [Oscarella lobularis]|uniref:protein disulfide-isomerase A3-like n=1 Tax=Oscarella lobularis TaxID=121494 RepID=UPI00331321F9
MVLGSALLLLCLACLARASDVLELTDSDFATRVAEHDIILVEFFAPWCGHCKRLAPEYEAAATILKDNDPPVSLAKVDCIEGGKESCGKYGVSGYPTLKIFRNGEMSADYKGPREKDGIVKYMQKQVGPSAKEMTAVEDMKKFIDNFDVSVVGFFAQEDDLHKAFMKTADKLRESFRFAYSTAAEVLDEYDYRSAIVVFQPPRLHSKLDDPKIRYPGKEDAPSFEEWLKKNFAGLVGHMTKDNEALYSVFMPLVVVYYDVDYVKNPSGTNYWRNRVLKVAKEFKGKKISFAIAQKSDYSRELQEFGLAESNEDVVVGIRGRGGAKYRMEEKFSVGTFKTFVETFLDDGLVSYVKSEPVPESNDGPVKVVVGKTFDEIVKDKTKDVLIEFYAPWCGHCKSLEPKYNELGEKLKSDPNIVIAKMDATANDSPSSYGVQGFPTLYWAPMGNKENPKKYEGGREVSDFISFLKKEATHPPVIEGGEKKKKKKKKEDL